MIRLLLSLVHIPEFNQIWSDLINNPAIFQPNFTGIKETVLKKMIEVASPVDQTVVLFKNRSKGIYENSNIEKIHKFVCDIRYGYKNKFYASQNPGRSTGAVRTMVYENVPDQHGIGHPPSRSYQIRLYMYYSDQ